MPTFDGTSASETLTGSDGDDVLRGFAGNDRIITLDGSDRVEAGDGDDEVNGFVTDAAKGEFNFYPAAGVKTVLGQAGNDFLHGGSAADSIDGGSGNDTLYGVAGADTLLGGDGNDTMFGGDGSDLLDGGLGNDSMVTGDGQDTVRAGGGDDRVNGQFTGARGGGYTYNPSSGAKVISGGPGHDFLVGGSDGDRIFGDEGDDDLFGRDSDDWLEGGAGDDSLDGGSGNDSLSGGSGNDTLDGGAGNDTYYVADRFAQIVDESGADTAVVSVSHVKLPTSVEKVSFVDGAKALPYWIDALLPSEAAGMAYAHLLGAQAVFRYAFPKALPTYDTNPAHAVGFVAFSSTQIARAIQALAHVATVCNLRFEETTNPAQPNTISFANNRQTGSAGYGTYPSAQFAGSDLFLDTATAGNDLLADGTYAALTLIHEIGHTLGLKHPFSKADADGDTADPPYLSGSEESTRWTVMSYADDPAHYQLRLRDLDIAALQYLYGPNPQQRAGDDPYVFDAAAANFVWDGAGRDRIDASASPLGVTVDLTPGFWGYAGAARADRITAAGQITVNFGTVIEDLVGSAQSDWLGGNDVANRIEGGGGRDTVVGGGGADTLLGGAGDDLLEGGAGQDAAVFSGAFSEYGLSYDAATGGFTVQALASASATARSDGTDALAADVEMAVFSDRTIALADFKTVGRDTTAPKLKSASPADKAVRVAVDANLSLTFDEAVQRGSGALNLKTASGQVVETFLAGSSRVTVSGDTLRVDPTATLKTFTPYWLEVLPAAVVDAAGNGLTVNSVVSFRTAAAEGLYQFFAVGFAAPPGAAYMGVLSDVYNGLNAQPPRVSDGAGALQQIIELVVATPLFTSVYPENMSNRDLANKLVGQLVRASAADPAKQAIADAVTAVLDAGWTRAQMLHVLTGIVASVPTADVNWGNLAKQFQNQLTVARYFTEDQGATTTDLTQLQKVFATITPATDVSTTDKIVAIIGTPPPGG